MGTRARIAVGTLLALVLVSCGVAGIDIRLNEDLSGSCVVRIGYRKDVDGDKQILEQSLDAIEEKLRESPDLRGVVSVSPFDDDLHRGREFQLAFSSPENLRLRLDQFSRLGDRESSRLADLDVQVHQPGTADERAWEVQLSVRPRAFFPRGLGGPDAERSPALPERCEITLFMPKVITSYGPKDDGDVRVTFPSASTITWSLADVDRKLALSASTRAEEGALEWLTGAGPLIGLATALIGLVGAVVAFKAAQKRRG